MSLATQRLLRHHRRRGRRWTANCPNVKRDLYGRVLSALRPDVVFVASLDYLGNPAIYGDMHNAADRRVDSSRAEFRRQLVRDTRRSLAQLTRFGAKVVIVEPPPVTTAKKDPFVCLQKADNPDQCRYVADQGISDDVNRIYRSVADGRTVFSLDLDRIICPALPVCDAVIGGEVTHFDYEHLAPRYAATLAPSVTALLQRMGLLER